MKLRKNYGLLFIMIMLFLLNTSLAFAGKYADVPAWAEKAVEKVDKEGILVGGLDGKFHPDKKIDKFEMVDVLAKLAGYKDPLITSNMDESEKNYIENAVKANEWFIDYLEQRSVLWKSSYNEKIAYLLQKGVLQQTDLNSFIIKDKNGKDKVSYLTKEQLTKYLACLLGFEDEAFKLDGSTDFMDDANINPAYKPYVSIMVDKEIIKGSGNKFDPKVEVTKVLLAAFVDKVLTYEETAHDAITSNKKEDTKDYTLTSLKGIVKEVYDYSSIRALKLDVNTNSKQVYRVIDNVEVLDGQAKVSFDKLEDIIKKDSIITVLIDNENRIVKINLGKEQNNNVIHKPSQGNQSSSNTNIVFDTVSGVIQEKNDSSLKIKIQYIIWGQIKEQTKTYELVDGIEISQNGKIISKDKIEVNSAITAKVSMDKIYKADITTKTHKVVGEIVDKKMYDSGMVLSIKNDLGKIEDLKMSSDTKIVKKGVKYPKAGDLKVGNYVTIDAEFDKIIEIYTETDYDIAQGYVEKIEISSNPKVTIKTEDGIIQEYLLGTNSSIEYKDKQIDLYSLRLGYFVEISVDGREISSLVVINKFTKATLEGVIENVEDNGKRITVKISSNDKDGRYYLRTYDVQTITRIYEGSTRKSRTQLEEGMRIILTTDENIDSKLSAIYIIQK